MNKVEIVADSLSPQGHRITSMVLTYPRIIHAELLTHRAFSRNAASSRAIRFEKMAQSVLDDPFIPMAWQKDHAGMQGTEYFGPDEILPGTQGVHALSAIKAEWILARNQAVTRAKKLSSYGVTKQLCNRLLEPFQMYQTLVTATEFENFVNLRASEFAEIHFADLAEKMLAALNESEPKRLGAGDWHMPFSNRFDGDFLQEVHTYLLSTGMPVADIIKFGIRDALIKIATVLAARISYLNQGKKLVIADDLKLHDRLATSGHWSAFEHCARAMSNTEYYSHYSGLTDDHNKYQDNPAWGWAGNFRGWIQYRKMFQDENRSDSRLIKKG